jgi:hypothetical protein
MNHKVQFFLVLVFYHVLSSKPYVCVLYVSFSIFFYLFFLQYYCSLRWHASGQSHGDIRVSCLSRRFLSSFLHGVISFGLIKLVKKL